MEKYKAIPQGYMTVGEIAKKTGVTVRTMQYYDKEGVLTPSAESEGGHRLYTDKEVIQLYQILVMKSLGFSLADIKNRLTSLETPSDVAGALTQQAAVMREKIEDLTQSLLEIERLKEEVVQMQTVNFKKYADIVVNLRLKNEFYWMIKNFDDKTLDHLRGRFTPDSCQDMIASYTRLLDEAVEFQNEGVPPDSERGQKFAREFWNMLMEFTGGNMELLSKLMEAGSFEGPDNQWKEKQEVSNQFIEQALGAYFTALDYNPMGEGGK